MLRGSTNFVCVGLGILVDSCKDNNNRKSISIVFLKTIEINWDVTCENRNRSGWSTV